MWLYTSAIKKNRHQAFKSQLGLCFYCNQPMWEKNPNSFISKYGLKSSVVKHLQCTAEHLIPRSEGGNNSKQNIVAACRYCNSTRHMSKKVLNPENYKKFVLEKLKIKQWHNLILNLQN